MITESQSRPKLTLSKPLSLDTLIKIKVKRSPQEIEAAKIRDKKNKHQRIKQALDWLCITFPDCFNKTEFKPLQLRIENEIFNSQYYTAPKDPSTLPSRKSLRDAISYYTHNIKYLKSHLIHTYRINLQGQDIPNDPVTTAHKDYAIQLMDRIKAKHDQPKLKSKGKPKK